MDIKHITSESLRRLLGLTDKKEQLVKAVADVEDQIANALKGVATATVEAAEAVTPFKPAKKAGKAKGNKPGGLKERILALLEAAGEEGVRVKDIAAKLAAKPGSISVWFSTTGKNITTKVEPGRYAAKGDAKAVATPKASKSAKSGKKRGGKSKVRSRLASKSAK
ncbi:MAG: hypothetical protein WC003_12780 [Terrimicrobiaceae bacterium]